MLFGGFNYQVVVRAVIEGTSPGRIWVDDPNQPTSGFMATTEGWFLAGDPYNHEFNQGLKILIQDMILEGNFYSPVNPEFLSYLFFHIDSEKWKERFLDIFDIRPPLPTHRIHYLCCKINLDWKNNIPKGYRLLQVDSAFSAESLVFPEDIKEWVESSLEDQKKRGFGKCLVHGNRVVVWINSDCASGEECEIGIITTEDYRLKGLGALTAAATVEHCFSLGYSSVGWHCEDHNYGSIGVAQKVGFVKERDYVHYICMFDEAEHFAERGMRHFYDKQYENAIMDFEEAFLIGKVPVWAYILVARAYATKNQLRKAIKYFKEAFKLGWDNWSPVLNSEEISLIKDNNDLAEFIKSVE
ncbi:MAG: GNAT family N-acetyltransferase [Candidatus Hodarchaeales archaeon]